MWTLRALEVSSLVAIGFPMLVRGVAMVAGRQYRWFYLKWKRVETDPTILEETHSPQETAPTHLPPPQEVQPTVPAPVEVVVEGSHMPRINLTALHNQIDRLIASRDRRSQTSIETEAMAILSALQIAEHELGKDTDEHRLVKECMKKLHAECNTTAESEQQQSGRDDQQNQ
jgi:hypothetical protein